MYDCKTKEMTITKYRRPNTPVLLDIIFVRSDSLVQNHVLSVPVHKTVQKLFM